MIPIAIQTSLISNQLQHLVLCDMVEEYLLARREKDMKDCLHSNLTLHQVLAETHDKLRWDNFVEECICTVYLEVVKDAFSKRSFLTSERWGCQFVSKLMQATHKNVALLELACALQKA